MHASDSAPSTAARWTGWILTGLVVVFFTIDGTLKLLEHEEAMRATQQIGFPAQVVSGLGLTTLAIVALYLYPRTAVLGAILMTGLLGGAVAAHLRIGSPLFTHVLFGVYVGVVAWLALFLRNLRLRDVLLGWRQP